MSLKNSSEYLLLNITQVTMSDGQKISIMCTDVDAISLVIWRYCDILKLFDFQFHFLFSFWNLKVVEFCRCDMCPPEMSVCETTRVLERERVCVEYIKKNQRWISFLYKTKRCRFFHVLCFRIYNDIHFWKHWFLLSLTDMITL